MKLSEIIKSENTVIHCATEGDARELCIELHRIGMRWLSGKSYKDYHNYTRYAANTCYRPLIGTYDNLKYCENRSFNIIPFSEVEFDEVEFDEADQPKTATACISDQPKPVQSKQIDWEQRRYEIAKDIFSRYLSTPEIAFEGTPEELIGYSVACADKLIEQLKQ